MKPYTYLLIDFLTVVVCFIFSFDKRIRFNRHFGAFLKASVIVAIPFVLWDAWFTRIGVWWFRDDYLTGLRLLGLPVEELLFFICIPFSCVFTYFCIDRFFNLDWTSGFNNTLVFAGVIACILGALLFTERIYTFVTALATAATLIYLHFVAHARWIGKATLIYIVLLPGFFMVNGVLTGTGIDQPIVNYNPDDFLGVRILTIPIEDSVYGYTLILLNIFFFQRFLKPLPHEVSR